MSLFSIVLIALLAYPLLALFCVKWLKDKPKLRKIVIYTGLAISALIIVCSCAGISTTSQAVDAFFSSLIYFTVALLLIQAFRLPNLFVKIVTGMVMFIVFGLSYLSGTVGILGVGFITNDLEEDRIIHLSPDLIYRQYNTGNAISDYRSIDITVSKTYSWLPFMEEQVFEKKYDWDVHDRKAIFHHEKNRTILYSYNFKVQYIALKKQLILLDSLKRDTIKL